MWQIMALLAAEPLVSLPVARFRERNRPYIEERIGPALWTCASPS
jgi:hypothetical protein